ncbi:MAG: sigma-70 family RNA polymerase sigma factor [Bacteroidota bacterium]
MGHKSDEELINSYLSTGDPAIFEDIFRRYRSLVFGVCTKYLDDKNDSMDATMLVFEKILNLKPSKPIRDLPNWLFTLTKHTCLDYIQKQRKQVTLQKNYEQEKINDPQSVENEEFVRLLNEDESKPNESDLKNAIAALDEDQKTCIELFYFKKMRYKQIAEVTGITEKQVKSLLQNGKKRLKTLLLKNQKKS